MLIDTRSYGSHFLSIGIIAGLYLVVLPSKQNNYKDRYAGSTRSDGGNAYNSA
ncbi:MAG: hypothetical protein U0X41_09255 [Chitinophagales bacterium]